MLTCEQIRFLGDPTAKFTKALDLDFDASGPFGGVRGKRYALKIEDGKVAEVFVEPDNAGFNGEFRSDRHVPPRNAQLTQVQSRTRRRSWVNCTIYLRDAYFCSQYDHLIAKLCPVRQDEMTK